MMQANATLRNNPLATKNYLLQGAIFSRINSTNNAAVSGNPFLRNRSGVGLVDAVNAVNISLNNNFREWNSGSGSSIDFSMGSFSVGQNVQLVMTSNKRHTSSIITASQVDNINLTIIGPNGATVVSNTTHQNVKVTEFVVTASGNYTVRLSKGNIWLSNQSPTVRVSWRVP
jgi:hypothetical protein